MPRSAFREHRRVTKKFLLPSRTQQSFKDETDINNIMAKYQKTGLIDHVNQHGPTYGDQPAADDYHAAMNMVANTNSVFAELPSTVRDAFENDPSQYLEYIADTDRREALINDKKFNHEDIEETPEPPVAANENEAPAAE